MTTLAPGIALLATGNELVEGDILNTNGQKIAQLLTEHGLQVGLHVIASDTEMEIVTALRFLLQTHDTVIITGGLGPTSDDRTRYALSTVVNKELIFDEASWEYIRTRFARLNLEPNSSNRQQALFPVDSQLLINQHGSAHGCVINHNHKTIYMLPGPPGECLPMFQAAVLPALLQKNGNKKRIKLSWRLTGTIESEIAARVDEVVKSYKVSTGYRVEHPYLEVKIYLESSTLAEEVFALVNTVLLPYVADNKKRGQ